MIKWIIDSMMVDEYYGGQFYQTLKRLGRDITVVDYLPFDYENMAKLDIKDRHIAYGSLQFVEKITSLHSQVASFGPNSQYDFNRYSCYLPSDLFVSKDYMFITMSFLNDTNKVKWLKSIYGQQVFIRPNTGHKLFSGQVIDLDNPASIRGLFLSGGATESTLAVISSPVNIEEEYRFFVSKKYGVLTGSTYSASHRFGEKAEYPDEASDFAHKVMKNFGDNAIDQILVIDIAKIECDEGSEYKLIEVNCASSSGMYACDCEPIILEMERIIISEDAM